MYIGHYIGYSLLHGHCPLCATWCYIGALVRSTFGPEQAHRLPGALVSQP